VVLPKTQRQRPRLTTTLVAAEFSLLEKKRPKRRKKQTPANTMLNAAYMSCHKKKNTQKVEREEKQSLILARESRAREIKRARPGVLVQNRGPVS
jgi:hypothetical protein